MNLGSLNLTEIKLSGVAAAIEKNKAENMESKGIKAHFALDESGILSLLNVDLVVEKTVQSDADEEGKTNLYYLHILTVTLSIAILAIKKFGPKTSTQ